MEAFLAAGITPAEARRRILAIPHSRCRSGLEKHWRVVDHGPAAAEGERYQIVAASVFWLFRWALNGNAADGANSPARDVAREVFEAIVVFRPAPQGRTPYQWIDANWRERAAVVRYDERGGFDVLALAIG